MPVSPHCIARMAARAIKPKCRRTRHCTSGAVAKPAARRLACGAPSLCMLVEIGTTRSVQSYIQQAPFLHMNACACAGSLLIPKSHWQCELPGQSSSRIASCPADLQVAWQVAGPVWQVAYQVAWQVALCVVSAQVAPHRTRKLLIKLLIKLHWGWVRPPQVAMHFLNGRQVAYQVADPSTQVAKSRLLSCTLSCFLSCWRFLKSDASCSDSGASCCSSGRELLSLLQMQLAVQLGL